MGKKKAAKKAAKGAEESATNVSAGCCTITPSYAAALALEDKRRAAAISRNTLWWASGETLRYMFLRDPAWWDGAPDAKNVVKNAFALWQATGMSLVLKEVQSLAEQPQIRIAFNAKHSRGTWSAVGLEAKDPAYDRHDMTMNFAEPMTGSKGAMLAVHEVGHALGLRHEHQNPTAGIEWGDEQKVIDYFRTKNGWSPDRIRTDVLTPFLADDFAGLPWDPQSIMNYEIPKGLIAKPPKYATEGLPLRTAISVQDAARMRYMYEARSAASAQRLEPFKSIPLDLKTDQQRDFDVVVDQTRDWTFTTHGRFDASFRLFEADGEQAFLGGADDAGKDDNVKFEARLVAGRRYILRLRMLYTGSPGNAAVNLYWD